MEALRGRIWLNLRSVIAEAGIGYAMLGTAGAACYWQKYETVIVSTLPIRSDEFSRAETVQVASCDLSKLAVALRGNSATITMPRSEGALRGEPKIALSGECYSRCFSRGFYVCGTNRSQPSVAGRSCVVVFPLRARAVWCCPTPIGWAIAMGERSPVPNAGVQPKRTHWSNF